MKRIALIAGLLMASHASAQPHDAMHDIATSKCSRLELLMSASQEELNGENRELFISMQLFYYGMIEGAALDLPDRSRVRLYADIRQLCANNRDIRFTDVLRSAVERLR